MAGSYNLDCRPIKAYRLDCGCLRYECSAGSSGTEVSSGSQVTTSQEINSCLIDRFRDNDGKFDFRQDKLETEADIVLKEEVGACTILLDGTIPNLFCLQGNADCSFPATGHFRYKDSYGIMYVNDWEAYGNRIDITFTTYDPRVPGEAPSGFMIGLQVYRKGVITTIRQVIEINDGVATIVQENSTQKVDYFRTTFDCGDEQFTDPFTYHLNCGIIDELEIDSIGSSGSI